MTAYEKQARYRRKCISEGRCPHCGVLCAPYSICPERRNYKVLIHMISRMIKNGSIVRKDGIYFAGVGDAPLQYKTTAADRRHMPRIKRSPADQNAVTCEIIAVLKGAGDHGLTEAEVCAGYAQRVRTFASEP